MNKSGVRTPQGSFVGPILFWLFPLFTVHTGLKFSHISSSSFFFDLNSIYSNIFKSVTAGVLRNLVALKHALSRVDLLIGWPSTWQPLKADTHCCHCNVNVEYVSCFMFDLYIHRKLPPTALSSADWFTPRIIAKLLYFSIKSIHLLIEL